MLRRDVLPGLIILILVLIFSPGATLAQTGTPDVDDPIQHHLSWGLEVMAGDIDELSVAEVEEHFDPSLLDHYPAEQFIEEFQQLIEIFGPLELVENLSDPSSPDMFRGVFRAESGLEISVMFQIDPKSGMISNIDIAPVHEAHPPATPMGTPAS